MTKKAPALGPDNKILETFRPANWVTTTMLDQAQQEPPDTYAAYPQDVHVVKLRTTADPNPTIPSDLANPIMFIALNTGLGDPGTGYPDGSISISI